MQTGSKRVMIISGEASGDLHGANLVREMLRVDPGIRFFGIGGDRMREAGVEILVHSSEMAVVGLTEVFAKVGVILRARKLLKDALRYDAPGLVILIDYPEFNLYVARHAKRRGCTVFYYISPQVWAWRKNRVFTIARLVDRMAVILPFEEDVYVDVDLDVRFVGHPLLDVVKRRYLQDEALDRFGLEPRMRTVALVPGSRPGEIERILPEMLRAAEILAARYGDIQFVLPRASSLERGAIEQFTGRAAVDVSVVDDDTYDVIGVADIAVVTSGTATLETALLEVPMVIVYRVSPLSYAIGRMAVRIDHIGLANIIAGRTIVPELIQGDATGEKIAREVGDLLDDGERLTRMRADLRAVRKRLGEPGAAARAARLACELIGEGRISGGWSPDERREDNGV